MTFWIIAGVLCLAALVFAGWPIYRSSKRLTPLLASVMVFTVAVAAGLYNHVGSPNVPSGRSGESLQDMESVMASLEARLRENPDDIKGWQMLARSNMSLQRFDEAVTAYERVMALEDGRNAQTMVDLALAILSRDNSPIEGRTAALIEGALAMDPNNPAALFYSGVAASNQGDTELAAQRWEVAELFRVAAKYNAPCHVHMRYAGDPAPGSIEALTPVIAASASTASANCTVACTTITEAMFGSTCSKVIRKRPLPAARAARMNSRAHTAFAAPRVRERRRSSPARSVARLASKPLQVVLDEVEPIFPPINLIFENHRRRAEDSRI